MREKGLILKDAQVKLFLESGRFRLLLKDQPDEMDKCYYKAFRKDYGGRVPPYQVGDVVWLRESYVKFTGIPDTILGDDRRYAWPIKADWFYPPECNDPFKALLHTYGNEEHIHYLDTCASCYRMSPATMPKWAARKDRWEITSVRVEQEEGKWYWCYESRRQYD